MIESAEPEDSLSRLVHIFCMSVETLDPYTRGHSERVTAYLLFLAERVYGALSAGDRCTLQNAGRLHDLGKLYVPVQILRKAGPLTAAEFALVARHPTVGAQLVAQVPGLAGTLSVIRHHHERYDGTGYPDGLKGHAIPLDARIAALADTFDAMTSKRSYRGALSPQNTISEFQLQEGRQFDPSLVRLVVRDYEGLIEQYEACLRYNESRPQMLEMTD